MASGALIAGAVVLVGGGVAYALYKKQQAAKKAAASSQCDALKGIDDGAYQACRIALDAVEIVGGIIDLGQFGKPRDVGAQWKARDDMNKQLNGAVAIPASEFSECMGWGSVGTDEYAGDPDGPPVGGSVWRFANGCEPVEGAPGWSKCAKGTASMMAKGATYKYDSLSRNDPLKGKTFVAQPDKFLTGIVTRNGDTYSGDPTSGVINLQGSGNCAQKMKNDFPLAFPMTLNPDTHVYDTEGKVAGLYKGKPYVCPQGRPIFDGRKDVACQAPGPVTTTVDLSKGNPPPGYTYVAAPTPHWERVRKGQTPQPYPGAAGGTDPSTLLLGYSVAPGH